MSKIEKKAAEAVLQNKFEVTIGADKYNIPRPTLRTFIAASSAIAELPDFAPEKGKEIYASINYAKHCEPIAKVFATLICGAKQDILSIVKRWRLKRRILNRYTPTDLAKSITRIIIEMRVEDFFALTTSLAEINLTKATKEVE